LRCTGAKVDKWLKMIHYRLGQCDFIASGQHMCNPVVALDIAYIKRVVDADHR
jgi:hypothetical protein